MQVLRRAMGFLGFNITQEAKRPDYHDLMLAALNRIRMAELLLAEATTLEELDVARSALLSGQAEVQQLIRTAKRERGITVRPIAETEEIHRNMREFMNHQAAPLRAARRKTGTGR